MNPRTLILTQLNGAGLQADALLLQNALQDLGHEVRVRTLFDNVGTVGKSDLAFHLEVPNVFWLPYASFHVWVPNMEWALPEYSLRSGLLDMVAVKTPSAVRLARLWGQEASLLGWTVLHGGTLPPEPTWAPTDPDPRVLHVCGVSLSKGTEAVYSAWDTNRDLPPLVSLDRTETWRKVWATREDIPLSVTIREERIPTEELRELRSRSMVAVQASVAEGFGHVIGEAMAAGQVTITVDAPPMNEVCPPSCGYHIAPRHSEPWRQGGKYFTGPEDVASAVRTVLSMPGETLLGIRDRARAQIVRMDQQFRERLEGLLLRFSLNGEPLTDVETH